MSNRRRNGTNAPLKSKLAVKRNTKNFSPEVVAGEEKTIISQNMERRHKSVDFEVPEILYDGLKKLPMPPDEALYQIQPLSFHCSQVISVRRSQDLDYKFMKNIMTMESCPEWSRYNTAIARKSGMAMKPKAKFVIFP